MGSRGLEPFDVGVLGAGDHIWVSVQSRQGSVFGISRTLPTWSMLDGAHSPATWLTDAVRLAYPVDDQAYAVGAALTELIFGDRAVATLFQNARGVAAARGAQLLVRILAAPADVSSLPWELLVDPQQPDRHLTLAPDVHVVRAARQRTYPVREEPIDPPLNLLIVMSSPLWAQESAAEAPFDLYAEKRSLLGELRPLVDRGLLRVDVEDRPTVERLRARMGAQQRGFHVLHYLGHAQAAGLKLESADGQGQLVSSTRFANLLQQLPDLRLALFAGCETARAPDDPAGRGDQLSAADLCVRDACPMVVGMQSVLPFGTERIFTRYFYQALTGGQSVVEAVRLARLAIADDEYAGSRLVNWAVPSLFVGGSEPGPLTNPDAKAKPVPAPRPLGLKLDIQQGELRFISRLLELRVAVDVLSGRDEARLLVVYGPPSTGKTGLLDRALEELDADIAYLFVPAARLLDQLDPVLELARLVAERIQACGQRPVRRGAMSSTAWWERLLQSLDRAPVAIVVDDADRLFDEETGSQELVRALNRLTARRSQTRLAVVATTDVPALTSHLRRTSVRTISLSALGWDEVWQWIRRNLPVLTRFDKGELSGHYAKLPQLEHWELLAREVAGRPATSSGDLPDIVRAVARSLGRPSASTQARPPDIFGRPSAPGPPPTVRPAQSPTEVLRVAVAGPFTVDREEQFAAAMTALAADHGVSGRVADVAGDPASSIAQLLALGTPFSAQGSSSEEDLLSWLDRADPARADIVLLDFGNEVGEELWDAAVTRLTERGRLVIASAGNAGEPIYPAWCRDALGVGRLDTTRTPAVPVIGPSGVDKPEIFAADSVAGSRLADTVTMPNSHGTTFSALHVMAAATLVWAVDRALSADLVRRTLIDTADQFEAGGRMVRLLNLEAALRHTRSQLLLDALESGPIPARELCTLTGMRPELAMPLIEDLVGTGRLHRVESGGVALIENPNAVYFTYPRLRQEPYSRDRTERLDRLLWTRVAQLVSRGRYTRDTVRDMWSTGDEGRRIVALGIVQADPRLGSAQIVAEAIRSPRTPFEQYHAFRAALSLAKDPAGLIDPDGQILLRDAVAVATESGPHQPMAIDDERSTMARELTALLTNPPSRP